MSVMQPDRDHDVFIELPAGQDLEDRRVTQNRQEPAAADTTLWDDNVDYWYYHAAVGQKRAGKVRSGQSELTV